MMNISILSVLLCCCSPILISALQIQVLPATPAAARAPTSRLFSTPATYKNDNKIDVSEAAQRNPDALYEWASYYGIITENFQMDSHSSKHNWGGYTIQAGRAGERALFVPAMMRITSQNVREQDFAEQESYISQEIDTTYNDGDTDIPLACHFYLFLKILQEYEQGADSAYSAWMDALPRSFTTAVTFTEFEIDSLPPFVKVLAFKDQANYAKFLRVLQTMDTPTINDATKTNDEITKWAFNVVFARARAAFGEAEIIPMPDMINHNSNPNVEVQYDEEGNVHVVLLRDVVAEEQLFKCYGQPTNPSRFLVSYGFFDTSSPATYCKLYPELEITPELRNMGFAYDRMVFYVEDGSIAEEVWDVVLFINIQESGDQDTLQAFYNAHIQGDEATKAQYHQYYMAQTCASLLEHVEETMMELDMCAFIMDAGGLGLTHKNIPMIRTHNEFVQQTFAKVKTNLETIQAGTQ